MNTERTVEQICRDFLVSSQVSDDWDATVAEFAKIVSPDIAALRRDAERWRKVEASHKQRGTFVVSVTTRGGYVLAERDQLADMVDNLTESTQRSTI